MQNFFEEYGKVIIAIIVVGVLIATATWVAPKFETLINKTFTNWETKITEPDQ